MPSATDREGQPWRTWYDRALWRHPRNGLRARQLAKQPLCEVCLEAEPPSITPATVAHHKQFHDGVWALFIDPDNLGSLCKDCHDRLGQLEDIHGYVPGFDAQGFPIDPRHPANRKA